MSKKKNCNNCWRREHEPESCDDCERMPRVFQDLWLPYPDEND